MLMKMFVSTALLFLAACRPDAVQGAEWDYSDGPNGPANWGENFPLCDDSSQSPVDIVMNTVKEDADLGPISFSGYDTAPSTMTVKNTGHAIQVDVDGSMKISGGKLPASYKLVQFHVHWGDANSKGSEHTVDGTAYPMEIHFVHYNENFGSFDEAKDQPQGLAVIGVFFKISDTDGDSVGTLAHALSNVQFENDDHAMTRFALGTLLPADRTTYFRYSGSLTTPTCDESVVWTILESKINITQTHMNAFRSGLYEGADNESPPLINNFRPVQSLNGRDVFSNRASAASDVTAHVTSVLFIVSVLNVILA